MKNLIAILLAVVMISGLFVLPASAVQTDVAKVSDSNVIYFDANSTDWNNYGRMYCHIWEHYGDSFFAWHSKKERCVDIGNGKWYYDLDAAGIVLEPGTLYVVIFSNENGMQTYNLLMDSTCIDDTAYCNGTLYENPEDSSKTAQAAFWRGQDSTKFGPEKCVTSIGNIVGTCIPSTTSAQDMFEDFLTNTLTNAQTYSGKNDQNLIDDTAAKLGLTKGMVEESIDNTGVYVKWNKKKSTLKDDATQDPSGTILILGDVDLDGIITVLDATEIQCYVALLKVFSVRQLLVADTDSDGYITVLDATNIQKYVAKLIPEFEKQQ